jgi:flavin reductase (DIM6/NTAB) family NADH-FMN oxidoreductase RutF
VTIHRDHPFSSGERDPIRQFRGRMAAPISIWAAVAGERRVGWTVSSFLVADGAPAMVVGLVDEDSDLAAVLPASSTFAVSLLGWQHRALAEAFAGLAPAPGGVFRLGSWTETDWGPTLAGAPAWLGARVTRGIGEHAGWALLIRAQVEHVEIGVVGDEPLLTHFRGRYVPISTSRSGTG